MANGFVDGIGYPMNGGLSAGIRMAKERQEQERQRGLASGFTQYMNAQDDAGKRDALSQMAQYDPNTAFNLMKYEQELANKDKMTPYQQATLDLQRKQFERGEQFTPYQQAQLDIQRQQIANQGKMNEYQTWQKDEALRKEQEAKEREKLLGDALYRYQIAQTDEDKNVALADVYRASPDFAKDILKKQSEKETKEWTTDAGRWWAIAHDPKASPEDRALAYRMIEYSARMPYVNYGWSNAGKAGTMAAEAGIYEFGQPINAQQLQTQPVQAQPIQERQIPTAAQLAADKKKAEKNAEYQATKDIDAQKGWVYIDGQKKALKGSEAEREWNEKNVQAFKNNEVVMRASKTVLSDIDAILRMAMSDPNAVSGIEATITSKIPETTAADVAARIDSIKGNIAIDSLLNIKKSGAGLGQVPQKQAEMLSGLLGNLSQKQSPAEFLDVLTRIREIYKGIVDAAEKENNDINSVVYDPNEVKEVQREPTIEEIKAELKRRGY